MKTKEISAEELYCKHLRQQIRYRGLGFLRNLLVVYKENKKIIPPFGIDIDTAIKLTKEEIQKKESDLKIKKDVRK